MQLSIDNQQSNWTTARKNWMDSHWSYVSRTNILIVKICFDGLNTEFRYLKCERAQKWQRIEAMRRKCSMCIDTLILLEMNFIKTMNPCYPMVQRYTATHFDNRLYISHSSFFDELWLLTKTTQWPTNDIHPIYMKPTTQRMSWLSVYGMRLNNTLTFICNL